MILNDNSTQQINTLVIQLQNRITNLNNELKSLNKEISNLDSKISDLEIRDSSQANDQANDIAAMNAEIKANTEAISGKADKNHTHIKSQITDFDHNHDDRYYTESEVDAKLSGKADKSHTHTKSEITDFPTSLPANGGKSAKSSFLDEYVGAGGTRPTSGNIIPKDATEYGGMRKDVVTSSMTDSGRPGDDGHLLTMFWDNNGRYDSQFFIKNGATPELKVRGKENTADYGPWTDVITSQNISSQTVEKAGTADIANNGTFGMLGGAKQAESSNFEDLLNNELCSNQTGGLRGGSIQVPVGQEAKNLGIPVDTWYNFLYIPHRTGTGGDNNMFGTLFVIPMVSNDGIFYIIHRISGNNYPAYRFSAA